MDFRTKPAVIVIERLLDIDVARVESALERAKEQLTADDPEMNRLHAEAALVRAQIGLRLQAICNYFFLFYYRRIRKR